MTRTGLKYSDAGVDLEKHRLMHRVAISAAKETIEAIRLPSGGLGSYSAWFKLGEKRLALHVDGVGTKTLVLEETGQLWVAGWDCVAMNVNDLAVAGFKPLVLVDYIAMPRGDADAFREVMRGLKEAAKKAHVAIIGGETAILPGLARGYDVVCAVLGESISDSYTAVAKPGDFLLGVESNGLHANGYSLARKVLKEHFGSYTATYNGVEIGRELSKPTHIYSSLVLEAIKKNLINSAAHITGGAFTKLGRILGENLYAEIEAPNPPRIFHVLMELGGIERREMYRVFNMGVGLVMSSPEEKLDELRSLVHSFGFKSFLLGSVKPGPSKIIINTPWGDRIEYKI